jgi:hypothetical protein
MTTGNHTITAKIWLPLQIKNLNYLLEEMLTINQLPGSKMQAKGKFTQQE